MTDSVDFYNKYLSVLKGRYNNLMNDVIHLETQNILLTEALESRTKENASLGEEIDRLNATISSQQEASKTRKATTKSVETEE